LSEGGACLGGSERQGRDQRSGKRRERHPSHIVPQDAAGAVVLITGARRSFDYY